MLILYAYSIYFNVGIISAQVLHLFLSELQLVVFSTNWSESQGTPLELPHISVPAYLESLSKTLLCSFSLGAMLCLDLGGDAVISESHAPLCPLCQPFKRLSSSSVSH